jgi:DNA-binding transcriptional LysR family regulator
MDRRPAIELRHLRYFTAVAEELSFTAAAHRLNVSQPPLSQQVRRLEEELGTALFERTSRRVVLTAAGAALLRRARAILAQVDEAADEARVIGQGQVGTLDVGLTGSVLLGPLAGHLHAFGASFPTITVRLHEMPPAEQQSALLSRRTDVCFLRRPPEDPELVVERAWPERVCAVLPKGHRLAGRATIALEDLDGESFVFLRFADSSFARYLWACCRKAGLAPEVTQQVGESYSLVSLVGAGLGVALVPEAVGRLRHPKVACVPLGGEAPVADVSMLYRAERTPVLDNFLGLIRARLSRDRPEQP